VSEHQPPSRGLHRDWRTWAAVAVLLLAAMAYVLDLDRFIVPVAGGPVAPTTAPSKP
jgi:hypothetical protein